MNGQHIRQLLTPSAAEQVRLDVIRDQAVVQSEDTGMNTLASVVWSRLVEPGDSVAHQLIEAVGRTEALAHVIMNTGIEEMMTRLNADAPHELTPKQLTAAFQRWKPRLQRQAVEHELELAERFNMRLILPEDPEWPTQLDDLGYHRPLSLWVRGRPELLQKRSVAVVGARASSAYGEHITAEISDALVSRGIAVVSGAAYGIDGVAHRSALNAGGDTIAVLAGGADRLYPQGHSKLFESIIAQGTLVSEVAPGSAPSRWRFLQRNRLISALSEVTIVTEAGIRSGSINTAGHAAELGRVLAAVPGPITSAGSHGCFRIINDYGATMFTGLNMLDELVGNERPHTDEVAHDRQLSTHSRIIDAIPLNRAIETTRIAQRAGLALDKTLLGVVELELLGEILRASEDTPAHTTWRLKKRSR